jgi:hypothetical protein
MLPILGHHTNHHRPFASVEFARSGRKQMSMLAEDLKESADYLRWVLKQKPDQQGTFTVYAVHDRFLEALIAELDEAVSLFGGNEP